MSQFFEDKAEDISISVGIQRQIFREINEITRLVKKMGEDIQRIREDITKLEEGDADEPMTRREVAKHYGVHYNTVMNNQRAIGFEPGNRLSKTTKRRADRYFFPTQE